MDVSTIRDPAIAYLVMAYVVMAHIGMAYIVMALARREDMDVSTIRDPAIAAAVQLASRIAQGDDDAARALVAADQVPVDP